MNQAIKDYLEKNKFEEVENEHFDSYRLKLQHKFLSNLEIYIENDLIIVCANNIGGSSEEIIGSELTLHDLKNIHEWLRK